MSVKSRNLELVFLRIYVQQEFEVSLSGLNLGVCQESFSNEYF